MELMPWKGVKKYLDYQNNTNISLVNRYCYFAVDKVANSTVKHCLYRMEYKGGRLREDILNIYDPRASPLLSPYQIPSRDLRESLWGGFRRFAFVRNPYTRLLSCFLDRVCTFHSRPSKDFVKIYGSNTFTFSDFVHVVCSQDSVSQNSHWRVQYDDLMMGAVPDTQIFYFENLRSGMMEISRMVFGEEDERMEVDKLNASPKTTNSSDILGDYYDRKLYDLVYDRYKKDFEEFGYDRM